MASLLLEKKKRVEEMSAFRERDSGRSETQTNMLHPFFHPNHTLPPRRATRCLGSALQGRNRETSWVRDIFGSGTSLIVHVIVMQFIMFTCTVKMIFQSYK